MSSSDASGGAAAWEGIPNCTCNSNRNRNGTTSPVLDCLPRLLLDRSLINLVFRRHRSNHRQVEPGEKHVEARRPRVSSISLAQQGTSRTTRLLSASPTHAALSISGFPILAVSVHSIRSSLADQDCDYVNEPAIDATSPRNVPPEASPQLKRVSPQNCFFPYLLADQPTPSHHTTRTTRTTRPRLYPIPAHAYFSHCRLPRRAPSSLV